MEKRVIICEDELLIALDLKKMLEKFGFKVIANVNNGDDLIKKVKELKPDLIITDITLKGKMSGIEAAKIISLQNEIPVIILSGIINIKTFQEVKKANLLMFITKPFDEKTLKKAIEEFLPI